MTEGSETKSTKPKPSRARRAFGYGTIIFGVGCIFVLDQFMHRMLLAQRTASSTSLCTPQLAPIIPKSQYRRQITRPFPSTSGRYACAPIGATTQFYDRYKETPYVGESFGYLFWRKRNCCAL